jgi:hypothetical protein
MSQTRRLAAILAADVAGYSRLMGADGAAPSKPSRLYEPAIRPDSSARERDGALIEIERALAMSPT